MFPDARKFLGEKRLVDLGEHLEARKGELAKSLPTSERLHGQPAARTAK